MTTLKNPLPADFREHLHKTVPEQIAMYGVGKHTIARWWRLCGVSIHQRAWTDEALATLRTLVEEGYSYDAIAKRMEVGRKRVANAIERYKLAKGVPQPRATVRPVPDDFVQMWTDNPVSWLVKHYGASTKTVRRWVVVKKLSRPVRGSNVRPVDFQRRPAELMKRYVKDRYKTAVTDMGAGRDTSPAGEAQSFLQREGYRPVCRCSSEGIPEQGGPLWICGRYRGLSDKDLIARADEIRERRVRMMGRAA